MIDIHPLGLVVERPTREREEAGSRPAGGDFVHIVPQKQQQQKKIFFAVCRRQDLECLNEQSRISTPKPDTTRRPLNGSMVSWQQIRSVRNGKG